MANPANIEVKAKQVEEIREKLEKAQSVVVFDYRGLTVEEVTNLRSEMRKAGVEYVVLKNHIVNRAAQANGVDESFHNYLKGPSAFAFGYDDAVAPARILKDTVKKLKKCEIKGRYHKRRSHRRSRHEHPGRSAQQRAAYRKAAWQHDEPHFQAGYRSWPDSGAEGRLRCSTR